MINLIDTHAHLNDKYYSKTIFPPEFFTQDNYNLERVIAVGYDKPSILKTIEIADTNHLVYGAVGCHPHDVNEYNADFERLIISSSAHPKIVAIGEIGLDYHRSGVDKERQKQVFIAQLKLAHRLELPVMLHVRDAFSDCIDILTAHKSLLQQGGMVHCFTGTLDDYKAISALGLKFSVGGAVTFKNAGSIISVVEGCNMQDLLLETDCPYLTPEPYRGRVKNQPIFTRYVLEKVAQLRGMPVRDVAEITSKNAYALFKKLN